MKRRSFIAAVGIASSAIPLTACSGDATGSGSDETLSPDTKAELTLFYWDKNQKPTVDANIAAFNKQYPNITVTTSIAAYKDYWPKLRTQAEGDQLPDVFWMNGPNIQLYASNGMLADLEGLSVEWSNYPQALVDLYTVDGKHYGIPKDYDTIACFVSKSLFEKAGVELPTDGWTWEEHNAAAAKIAATGAMGVVGTVGQADGQGSYYNTMFQAGGYVIKDNKSGFDDPNSIRGLQFWTDLIANGSMPSLQAMSDTLPSVLFANGQAGILWAGSWTVPALVETAKDLDDIVVVPLPKDKEQATVIHGLSYVASAKSKNAAAAKALVQAMTTEEAAKTEATNGTAIPAFNGTQEQWIAARPTWQLDVFTKAAEEYSVSYPVSKNTSAWEQLQVDMLPEAFSGKKPVEDVATAIAEQMNALLAKE